jgi:hypothetical protein
MRPRSPKNPRPGCRPCSTARWHWPPRLPAPVVVPGDPDSYAALDVWMKANSGTPGLAANPPGLGGAWCQFRPYRFGSPHVHGRRSASRQPDRRQKPTADSPSEPITPAVTRPGREPLQPRQQQPTRRSRTSFPRQPGQYDRRVILRCTSKLLAVIGPVPAGPAPAPDPGDWYANLPWASPSSSPQPRRTRRADRNQPGDHRPRSVVNHHAPALRTADRRGCWLDAGQDLIRTYVGEFCACERVRPVVAGLTSQGWQARATRTAISAMATLSG